MLHCADRSFYVGHTDDLEKRMGEHEKGLIPGYTSDRLPVTLVWSQEFATRDEARMAESRLKGWSRAKKLALIRADWARISALARGKEGASTSSAKPEMFSADVFLHPHLGQVPSDPLSLQVRVRADEGRLIVRYRLTGTIDGLAIPARDSAAQKDELWRHTCFEAFVEVNGGPGYFEFNFSPSGEWAAYRFAAYRTGMCALAIDPPRLRCSRGRHALDLSAVVQTSEPVASTRIALSAVIEETSGRKSYWALAHPPGPPDFHHPDCFTLELPAPARP